VPGNDPLPADPSFAVADVWNLRYHPEELDDGGADWYDDSVQLNELVNGESTARQDIVLWYRMGERHDGAPLCEMRGPRLVPSAGWADQCPAGATPCGAGCVYVASDTQNCGACGVTCGTGQFCVGGECTNCPPGTSTCQNNCIDLQTSRDNCGQCGHPCVVNEACGGGLCRGNGSTCPTGVCECFDGSTFPAYCNGTPGCFAVCRSLGNPN
jgi:hypothetical protein